MNSILEEMDALVEQFYEDCDRFIERMKEYERIQEENLKMTRQAAANWDKVNNQLDDLRHG